MENTSQPGFSSLATTSLIPNPYDLHLDYSQFLAFINSCSSEPLRIYGSSDVSYDTSDSAKLGEGAYMTVIRGHLAANVPDGEDSKPLAFKRSKAQIPRRGASALRARELEILTQIGQEMRIMRHPPLSNHPNIPRVRGVHFDEEANGAITPTLIMDIALGTLQSYECQSKPDWTQKLELWRDVACGLDALHRCNILHGDVKTTNTLIFDRGDFVEGTIADFGGSSLSPGLPAAGTALYSAPLDEDETTEVDVDGSVRFSRDVYAFGLLCFESSIRRSPTGEHSTIHLGNIFPAGKLINMKKSLEFSQQLVHRLPSDCPPVVAGIISRCVTTSARSRCAMADIIKLLDEQYVFFCIINTTTNYSASVTARAVTILSEPEALHEAAYPPVRYLFVTNTLLMSKQFAALELMKISKPIQLRVFNEAAVASTHVAAAAFRLAACFTVGFGTDRDEEKRLEALVLASRLGSVTAAKHLVVVWKDDVGKISGLQTEQLVENSFQSASKGDVEAVTLLEHFDLGPGGDMRLLSARSFAATEIARAPIDEKLFDDGPVLRSIRLGDLAGFCAHLEVAPHLHFTRNGEGQGILHVAASTGQTRILEWFFGRFGQFVTDTVNDPSHAGYTPLLLAARSGQSDTVAYLINNLKASLLTVNQRSVILAAIESLNSAACREVIDFTLSTTSGEYAPILLNAPGLVNLPGTEVHEQILSPVELASYLVEDMEEILNLLIDRGAQLNSNPRSRTGLSPLHYCASRSNSWQPLHKLISAGSAVDPLDINGRSPLMYAVNQGRAYNVGYLLARGADPDLQTKVDSVDAGLSVAQLAEDLRSELAVYTDALLQAGLPPYFEATAARHICDMIERTRKGGENLIHDLSQMSQQWDDDKQGFIRQYVPIGAATAAAMLQVRAQLMVCYWMLNNARNSSDIAKSSQLDITTSHSAKRSTLKPFEMETRQI